MKALSLIYFFCMATFTHAQIDPLENSFQAASLFIEAIKSENYKQVELLLEQRKVSINETFKGKTFITYACIFNKPEMVRFLFSNGADISIRCKDGYLPKDHAVANKAVHALSELIIIDA